MNYFLCSTHRSGSSMLCDLLIQTKVAGIPSEHFLAIDKQRRISPAYEKLWSEEITPNYFLENIKKLGTGSNGNFGCSIMWNNFKKTTEYLRQLTEYKNKNDFEILMCEFPELKVIRIVRRSKLRQAISLVKAQNCDAYNSIELSAINNQHDLYSEYDFQAILYYFNKLYSDENNWKCLLDENNIDYLTIIYEDLISDISDQIDIILCFLDIEKNNDDFDYKPRLQKQSDEINEQWHKRFIKDFNQMV